MSSLCSLRLSFLILLGLVWLSPLHAQNQAQAQPQNQVNTIDGGVWHLDVGSSHPGAVAGPKGMAVRHLKWYVSWVQNVVRQFGPYLQWALEV